jgi:hypothetical protein
MKNIFNKLLLAGLIAGLATGCVDEDDTQLSDHLPVDFAADFNVGADGTILTWPDWINYAEAGDALWTIQRFSSNGYAEFSSFQSGDLVNIGWLVSPAFELAENNTKKLRFQASQSFVSSSANKLEVLISTDFDGNPDNITSATWTPLQANLPGTDAEYFLFFDSGIIDLSAFSGTAHIAFKVTGSGTNTALDGSYQIDNPSVYDSVSQ